MEIYIFKNDAQSGPYTLPEISARLSKGVLLKTDLACQTGMEEWVSLESLLSQLRASKHDNLNRGGNRRITSHPRAKFDPRPLRKRAIAWIKQHKKLVFALGGVAVLGLTFLAMVALTLLGVLIDAISPVSASITERSDKSKVSALSGTWKCRQDPRLFFIFTSEGEFSYYIISKERPQNIGGMTFTSDMISPYAGTGKYTINRRGGIAFADYGIFEGRLRGSRITISSFGNAAITGHLSTGEKGVDPEGRGDYTFTKVSKAQEYDQKVIKL